MFETRTLGYLPNPDEHANLMYYIEQAEDSPALSLELSNKFIHLLKKLAPPEFTETLCWNPLKRLYGDGIEGNSVADAIGTFLTYVDRHWFPVNVDACWMEIYHTWDALHHIPLVSMAHDIHCDVGDDYCYINLEDRSVEKLLLAAYQFTAGWCADHEKEEWLVRYREQLACWGLDSSTPVLDVVALSVYQHRVERHITQDTRQDGENLWTGFSDLISYIMADTGCLFFDITPEMMAMDAEPPDWSTFYVNAFRSEWEIGSKIMDRKDGFELLISSNPSAYSIVKDSFSQLVLLAKAERMRINHER